MVAKIGTLNNKEIKTCVMCGKKIRSKTYDDVCSKKCIDEKLDYYRISIPIPFIKRVFSRLKDEDEQQNQLKEYAKRHNFNPQLTIKKAKIIYTKLQKDIL